MNKNTDRFLEIFCEIAQIPRESSKEERFADYLENFALKNNLECYRDKNNNVLIKKQGNKENNEPIILQAHIDMVCVKRENSNHNFETDPIEIIRDGDAISAKDTTLGADQGIGLAIMLLILENKEIKHPDLECLFTTEEETTYNGAFNFDYSKLKAKKLINIDHCKDNSIVIGSDADICNKYIFKGNLIERDIPAYYIKISNIKGGNSGIEIERSSKNAITIMAKIIEKLQKEGEVLISYISGGTLENDIATSCECVIKTTILNIEDKIREILEEKDAQLQVSNLISDLSFSLEDSEKIINEIINLKQGVVTIRDNEIITSGNIGLIETLKNQLIITGIIRSIDEKELQEYNEQNIILSKNNNFVVEEFYNDSAWLPDINSKLKQDYANIYYELFGENLKFEIVHAGLECSCIAKRIGNIDMISIGSIIEDFHTVNEKMYISSCEKTLKILLAFLESEKN